MFEGQNVNTVRREQLKPLIEQGLYVKVINGIKEGTIARVVSGSSGYYSAAFTELRLKCDGKREFDYKSEWCEILSGVHETKYTNDLKNVPVTEDIMGVAIEIGTVVCFAERGGVMCLGVVRRITEKGGVFVETLREGQRVTTGRKREVRIPYADQGTYVIRKDALDKVMMAKLAEGA